MSPSYIPAGGIAERAAPETTPFGGSRIRYRYLSEPAAGVFLIRVPIRPPADVLLDVVMSEENGTVAMNAVDLDVAVEEKDHASAVLQLMDAVQDWLEYLRDEAPELAPELVSQRRFVELLEYDRGTWFKALFIA